MNTSSACVVLMAALSALTGLKLLLEVRQRKAVSLSYDQLSSQAQKLVNRDTYSEVTHYSKDKSTLRMVSESYSLFITLLALGSGFLGWYDNALRQSISSDVWRGVSFICGLMVGGTLLQTPLSWYKAFHLEKKHGFSTITPRIWCSDFVKGLLLTLLFSVPLIWAVLTTIKYLAEAWWIWVACIVVGFQIFGAWIFPKWIAPLFNKMTPLEDGSLKSDIAALSERLAFPTDDVLVSDGSSRSTHANAYFAGFGKDRRIVLFDTLIDTLTPKQVCAVLAHEIGHAKLGHIIKNILLSAVSTTVMFFIASRLLNTPALYSAGGFNQMSTYAGLCMLSMAAEPLLFFISPLFSLLSRKHEYEADRYAAEAVKNTEDLSNGLLLLSGHSKSHPQPDSLYSFFYFSHPPLVQRLHVLETYTVRPA